MEIFAERLKDLREEKGLSLSQLAREIGVSHVAILRWENNTRIPNIESLKILANYFGVTTDYLLGLEDWYEDILWTAKRVERGKTNKHK